MEADSAVSVSLFVGQETLLYQPVSHSRTFIQQTPDTNKEPLQITVPSVIQSISIQSSQHCSQFYIIACWETVTDMNNSQSFIAATATYCL